MSCTNAGTAVKTTNKGINVRAGTKAADTPRRIVYGRTRVGGVWAYAETTGATNEYLHLILLLCDGPIQEIESIYFGDELVTLDGSGNGTGKWAGVVSVTGHLGETDQVADAGLVAASAGKWTASHKLSGIAYLYVKLTNWDATAETPSPALFGAVPNVSAVIKGRSDILDMRTGVEGYTDNAALCMAHYRFIHNCANLDTASVQTAADACDVLVSGRKRYTVGGMIEASASVEDVTRQFLTAMSGALTANASGHFLRVGAPPPPAFVLTWDNVRTNPRLRRKSGTGDTFTGAAATETTNWQVTDSVSDSDAKTVLKLDLVNDDQQAQALAQLETAKNGPTETLSVSCALTALDLVAGDAIDVDLQPLSYGRYEIVSVTINPTVTPTIDLELERQRTSLYDDPATTAPTANTVSVSPRSLSAPVLSSGTAVFPAASFPLSITSTIPSGSTLRWSLSSQPATESDGAPYFGSMAVPAPSVGAYVTLYVTAFRKGWSKSTAFASYTNSG